VNLIALWFLFPVAKRLLHHYETRLEGPGPINFQASDLPDEDLDSMSWTAAETSR